MRQIQACNPSGPTGDPVDVDGALECTRVPAGSALTHLVLRSGTLYKDDKGEDPWEHPRITLAACAVGERVFVPHGHDIEPPATWPVYEVTR